MTTKRSELGGYELENLESQNYEMQTWNCEKVRILSLYHAIFVAEKKKKILQLFISKFRYFSWKPEGDQNKIKNQNCKKKSQLAFSTFFFFFVISIVLTLKHKISQQFMYFFWLLGKIWLSRVLDRFFVRFTLYRFISVTMVLISSCCKANAFV